jgi:outer membrane protein assembly factor BamB
MFLCVGISAQAQQAKYGFRGASRDGIYTVNKKLLKTWSPEGLPLLWSSLQIGKGYSSPVAADGKVYVTGLTDDGSQEMLSAFDADGKLLWQTVFGHSWSGSYSESRSTPTVAGTEIYVESGKPELVCIDAASGKILWSVDAVERYNRKPTEFGPAESPLIVGNVAYFTTMSDKAALVAIDRISGKVIWETPPYIDNLMYASPIMIEHKGKKQIIILSETYAAGIRPDDGSIAWKTDIRAIVKKGMEDSHWRPQFTNTPIFRDGKICIAAGYDYGAMLLQLNDDASQASLLWLNRTLDTHHGGMALVNGYLYGSTWTNNSNGNWACVEWKTGKTMYEERWQGGNKGSVLFADGMLYCLEEKSGNLALVKPNPEKFEIVSSFKITEGSGPFWAHPSIDNDGRIYVRHGEALMVYSLDAAGSEK